jgi:hypothetical protein
MQNTTTIVRRFEQFVATYGDDPFISKTIGKMLKTRLNQMEKELKTVQTLLNRFERNYNKTSSEFVKEYQAGLAGDDMDAIEWSSLIKMRERLLSERSALQGTD